MTPALVCLPIALLLVYAVKIPLSIAMAKQPEGYDNKDPREQQARLPSWGKRANAAHQNGFESFAPFAAAVLTASVAGAPAAWINGLAMVHVIARAIFPVLYIYGIDRLRSLVWLIGFVSTLVLFFTPLFR